MQSEHDDPIVNFRFTLSVIQIDRHPSGAITEEPKHAVRVAGVVDLVLSFLTCEVHINRSTDD